ncbi:MAG: arginine decarboxylase, partial [Bacillota bacterium]
ALQEGAQASVHGLHKTMPVLTQAGIMHLAAGFPWRDKVQACHDLLTTTSPSYPLMASIDIGRAVMQEHGRDLLNQAKVLSERCRQEINEIPGFFSRSQEFLKIDGVAGFDPLKILVQITDVDLDGYQLSRLLRKRYGIQVELGGENYVLTMFSPFSSPGDWNALAAALKDISQQTTHQLRDKKPYPDIPPIPPLAITPRESFLSPHKTVMIKESKGMISAEMAAAYPPGIPCVIPGEIITAEVVEYLTYLKLREIPVHGLQDRSLQSIQVVSI